MNLPPIQQGSRAHRGVGKDSGAARNWDRVTGRAACEIRKGEMAMAMVSTCEYRFILVDPGCQGLIAKENYHTRRDLQYRG